MERTTRHLSYANVAATLALVFAMSGGAIAATGGFTSNGKLQGCVGSNGALSVVKPGKKCKKGQTAVAWNQTGPNGASGAPGAPGGSGAAGAAGAIGAAGTNGQDATTGDVKWAYISESGLIKASSGVTGVKNTESPYEVTFDRDLSECAVTATSNDVISTNKVTTAQHIKPETIRIFVKNAANEDEAAPTSIIAICPE